MPPIDFSRYDAVLFDLAGVLLNLNLERDEAALHAVGLPDFAGCLANESIRRPCLAYLNGLSSDAELYAALRPLCRKGMTEAELRWAMDAVLDDIPPSRLALLCELRRTHRVYLLSNLYDRAWRHTLAQFAKAGLTPAQCFDRVFLSFEMRLAKPDPTIFRRVISETGLNPSTTLYLDDTAENIEAGAALGFHAVRVPMNRLEALLPR